MPAYQAERWIAATLESVLSQTSPPHEIVVVDDGSTDQTAAIARGFGDPVRVVHQPNAGPSAAYNRAFRESVGSYVAMCPADDLWEPRKLEFQLETLTAHPEVDVSFGGARYFGLEDAGLRGTGGQRDPRRAALLPRDVPHPTSFLPRQPSCGGDLFDDLGGFREDLACEDYEFWMRALKHGAVFFHDPRLLVRLRQHGGNVSAQTCRCGR